MSKDQPKSGVRVTWSSTIVQEPSSGWACVVVPRSGTVFGTRKAVRVHAAVDGVKYDATLLPMGDGTHMLPIKASVRRSLKKDVGDPVDAVVVSA